MAKLCIGDIPVGAMNWVVGPEIEKTKFALSIDNIVGDVDLEGHLIPPVSADVVSFDGVREIIPTTFNYLLAYKSSVNNIIFPDLELISGSNAMSNSFRNNEVLKTASFPKLKKISGSNAMYYVFYQCSSLESLSFDELETIEGQQSFYYVAYNCTKLTDISFPKLAKIDGSYAFYYAFQFCTSLQRVDFPELKEVTKVDTFGGTSTNETFRSCTSLTEIHFRADMQSTIEKQTRYTNKFGATNATIYFDL